MPLYNMRILQYTNCKLKEKETRQPPTNQFDAKHEAEEVIRNAIVDCLRQKCNVEYIKYISPQELTQHLPSSLEIDRKKHVIKHHSGQWEIRNKNIHCYLGFQVVSNDYDLKQLLSTESR